MKTYILLIAMFLCSVIVFAQESDTYAYEIELGHDNDFFIIYTGTDRYYTYGINAAFRWKTNQQHFLFQQNENYVSHYNEINANVEAYTPDYLSGGAVDPNEERPYAGWSYINYTQSIAFNNSFLRIGADVGIIGPDSKAGDIQNWFHRQISGDAELDGWDENQLPNQFGFNIRGKYGMDITNNGLLNIYGTMDASLGNVYINARPMIHARFGKFEDIQYSVGQDNQLLGKKKQTEYYIDTGVGVKASAYNATVQGYIFDNNDLFAQDDINNFLFNGYFGLCFLKNKTSIEIKYHLTTGELESSEVNRYGTVSIAQRL